MGRHSGYAYAPRDMDLVKSLRGLTPDYLVMLLGLIVWVFSDVCFGCYVLYLSVL